jgi:hypothetical protein
MQEPEHPISHKRTELPILVLLPLAAVAIHLLINAFGGYGLFRDELYYLSCSKRLDWGYVDQPSFSLIILAVSRLIFGESLFAVRLVPALTGGAVVFLTGLIAREMKGSRWAIGLAMLASLMSPHYLAWGGFYSMNVFELFFWALTAYILIRLINSADGKYWYLLGLASGLGVLNKLGILWFIAGIAIGILFSPGERRWLTKKEPYLAAGIIALFMLPYLIWNLQHNFATLEFIRNASQDKYGSITPLDFLAGQLLLSNPLSLPLWVAGLISLLIARRTKGYRILGIAYLVAAAILLVNGHSKAEYLAPAYSMLFAAGAATFGRRLEAGKTKWLKVAYPMVLIITGILLAPFAVPVLPVEKYLAYQRTLGVQQQSVEGLELQELPQFYADMFGWEELAKTVSDVYLGLPEEERGKTVVYARNYGRASALEYYGKKYPLPTVVSPHNSWWYWGVDEMTTGRYTTIIIVGGNIQDHLESAGDVRIVATHRSQYSMPYENNLPIFVARELKRRLEDLWQEDRFSI